MSEVISLFKLQTSTTILAFHIIFSLYFTFLHIMKTEYLLDK